MISGETKIFAIMGDPVEHSLSPTMHNAAFRELGLNYLYVAFRVSSSSLRNGVESIRALNIKGVNITIPHKIAVLNYLDELDEFAKMIGAVNTIKNECGRLRGFNTDGKGAIRALKEKVKDIRDASVLLLGAGGAARSIAFSLAKSGAELSISNRTFSKAEDLADSIEKKIKTRVKRIPLKQEKLKKVIAETDILINATSVGMYPKEDETLVNSDMMHSDLVVKDIVYKPVKTRLLREAEKAKADTIDGLSMLVHQGAESFEIWTGQSAPIEVMRKATKEALESG